MFEKPNHHVKFLDRCYHLAKQAVRNGDHPFGAVLVVNNVPVLEALNKVNTDTDVTAHAELRLVRSASRLFSKEELNMAILYSSTEPCAMCSGAIYWAGIRRVVYGCSTKELDGIVSGGLKISSKEVFASGAFRASSEQGSFGKSYSKIHQRFWPQS